MLQLVRRQLVEIGETMLKHFLGNRRLNIGRLRLNALVADRRKLALLVRHTALLPAHAVGAGFTGVL